MTVSILCDIACELGEGPSYDRHTDTLWWFDIAGRRLLEWRFGEAAARVHELPFMASVLARIDDAHQLIASEHGLHIREIATGALTLHQPIEADNPATRSNDGRVHPSGALWVGTMSKKHEHGAGAIYWYFRGELRLLYPGITIPNAICFSPDGGTAYFADTETNRIMRVACEPETGLPVGEPELFFDNAGNEGWPDGAVCDAEGVVWNTRWGGGVLDAYSPGGERIRSIAIPARRTSCPAFIGADAGKFAVTTAWQGMDAAARAADPNAGFTFVVDAPVKGRFEPDVKV